MIPLRDNVPSRSIPVVNYVLIAINAVAFAWQLSLGPALEPWVMEHALVPLRFWRGLFTLDPALFAWPVLLSTFLHGGWLHLLGNMLYLWIFGDNVEDRLGHARYLLFYLFAATAGVMGAYFLLFPRARVLTAVPIFIFVQLFEIPAFAFLLFWFAMQFFSGSFAILGHAGSAGAGVAWWAHIGGFVAGVAVGLRLRGQNERRGRELPPAERGWS